MTSPEAHSPSQTDSPRRVAITGASGFLGSALAGELRRVGATIHAMRRGQRVSPPDIPWNGTPGPAVAAALEGVDAVVNLAGEPLAQRWTDERKRRIRDSRIAGTAELARTLASLRRPPRVLVSGSAIGVYGDRGDEELDEASAVGTGFLAEVAQGWERATAPAAEAGIRVVYLRTGLVLNPHGGALKKMLLPFKMGLGGPVGSGRQWMSWISLTDWVRAALQTLRTETLSGPVNLVAPNPVQNAAFAKTLARLVHRPSVLPLPSFAVDALFGEMGEATLLGSQRVHPRQLMRSGFAFAHPELEAALRAELD